MLSFRFKFWQDFCWLLTSYSIIRCRLITWTKYFVPYQTFSSSSVELHCTFDRNTAWIAFLLDIEHVACSLVRSMLAASLRGLLSAPCCEPLVIAKVNMIPAAMFFTLTPCYDLALFSVSPHEILYAGVSCWAYSPCHCAQSIEGIIDAGIKRALWGTI